MSKTITLRLTDTEYEQITGCALYEHRPISNFITHTVLEKMEESMYVDPVEMAQIRGDEALLKKLKRGHEEAKRVRKVSH